MSLNMAHATSMFDAPLAVPETGPYGKPSVEVIDEDAYAEDGGYTPPGEEGLPTSCPEVCE